MRHIPALLTSFATLSLLAGPQAMAEAPSSTATLEVVLTDIEDQTGTVRMALFAGEANYESDQAVAGINLDIASDTATASFADLAPGEYGIKLYHDVNDNGELDTNPFGMPTEPFAFSNNARGRFGPAKWDAAAFTVSEGTNQHSLKVGG